MPKEETMTENWLRAACFGMLVGGVAGLLGCAEVSPLPPSPSTPVSLSAFTSVTGKWAGILRATTRTKKDDWVTLMIREDGTYSFESVRTIGIFHGRGTFTLIDGKLRTETERGWGLATLYEEGGRRMLKVEGATRDGVKYAADLDPVK
jgi:hypothetical protein